MEPLLKLLKYIAEHPEKTMTQVLERHRFSEGSKCLRLYGGRLLKHCPSCHEPVDLTKHHIIPKKNGGKGVTQNYIYICRKCHDIVHEMFSKRQKMEAYLLEHPNATEDELMRIFKARRNVVLQVLRPEYMMRCQINYEARIRRRIQDGLQWFDHPEHVIRLLGPKAAKVRVA